MSFDVITFLDGLYASENDHLSTARRKGQLDVLPNDVADWPEEWREEFEERAAIMEYDGRLPRPQAEQWAETIVRAAYNLHQQSIGDPNA